MFSSLKFRDILEESIKLPHVRQLQESSLGLSRGCSAGRRHRFLLVVYTVFRDFEALALDSQHLISLLPSYLPCIIYLLGADLRRSEGPHLGVPWESQETPGSSQETPRKHPGSSQEAHRNLPEGTSQETSQEPPRQETFQETSQETFQEI